MVDDDFLDPYEQALLWTEAEVGILVTSDEQMHLVAIGDRVVADCVGEQSETLTGRGGVVFWFREGALPVNRMATLNLLAATWISAFTLPLLRGPVLMTGADSDGGPAGLSGPQFQFLKSGPGANRWQRVVLRLRAGRR
ncbi:hypothetical protein JF729_06845 [Mycobacterium intracellulare]|uniref:hypothetical protein n=1 Tax=Mycobacterium intracellulare TaxID=1767 RepID=UPI001CD9F801|nr:hypothetical protein [Mycobacterium intracellulare]MCA2247513.1 hypothetical protein [Mycobacterium intracellulare]